MNWYAKVIKISGKPQMSYSEALSVFGFLANAKPTEEAIRNRYRDLAKQYHPDKQGGDLQKIVSLNNAKEVLMTVPSSSRHSQQTQTKNNTKKRRPESPVSPPWQTDRRSSYNDVTEDLHDINWAKKTIYEYSIERGSVDRWSIYTHDGGFFRDGATFFTNKASLEYAAKVVTHWSSKHRRVEAVVAALDGSNEWVIVTVRGMNVIDKQIKLPEVMSCHGIAERLINLCKIL